VAVPAARRASVAAGSATSRPPPILPQPTPATTLPDALSAFVLARLDAWTALCRGAGPVEAGRGLLVASPASPLASISSSLPSPFAGEGGGGGAASKPATRRPSLVSHASSARRSAVSFASDSDDAASSGSGTASSSGPVSLDRGPLRVGKDGVAVMSRRASAALVAAAQAQARRGSSVGPAGRRVSLIPGARPFPFVAPPPVPEEEAKGVVGP